MNLQTPRGTHDLLPDACERQSYITALALKIAGRYGFREMATPIFEFSEVFKRTLGDASDIVNKEMYSFQDRGGEWLTLRPEGTAGVARAFISEGLSNQTPYKIIYHGPMFRYERPQKGRQRQFHQIGVECLGVGHPSADVECIAMAQTLLDDLGIANVVTLELNTIGDTESRKTYSAELVNYLNSYVSQLSADSQRRLFLNPLRILDSKDTSDQKILAGAPKLESCLSNEAKEFFAQIRQGLDDLGISYKVNPHLVRGLDYYSHCVFEFRTQALGAQDAVLSGGRYDGLIETMGGPATPGVGWAAGLERLALLLGASPPRTRPVTLIAIGTEGEREAVKIANHLRRHGVYVELTYSGNLSKRMKKASTLNSRYALIIGADEIAKGEYALKDLDSGEQRMVAQNQLLAEVQK